ncbi:MAG: hypothetical protein JWP89_1579 [Schlesneria sp.]|nr:hypothetical protein [Schlesneria sp.]
MADQEQRDVEQPAGPKIHSASGRVIEQGPAGLPNPQVLERPVRRQFTKAYKLEVLARIEASGGTGQIGSILRREGLYSSHLTSWRHQRDQGRLQASASDKRAVPKSPVQDQSVAQLQRENARLQTRLQQAELMLEIQKKASEILGITLKAFDNEGSV